MGISRLFCACVIFEMTALIVEEPKLNLNYFLLIDVMLAGLDTVCVGRVARLYSTRMF